MNTKILSKIIGGVVIGGMVLSVGSIAMADSNTNTAKNIRNARPTMAMMEKTNMGGLKKVWGDKGKINMKVDFQTVLNDLVQSGKITKSKADAFQSFVAKRQEERKAEFEKYKNMTPEERKAQMEKLKEDKAKRPSVFDEAVSQGIITQDEAKAIKDQLHQMKADQMKKQLSDKLSPLVDKGTITQEQKDKIMAYMEKERQNRRAIFEKTKDMTPEQRKEYMKSNIVKKKGMLSGLVEDKVITQAQADEISKLLHPKRTHKDGGRKFDGNKQPGDSQR